MTSVWLGHRLALCVVLWVAMKNGRKIHFVGQQTAVATLRPWPTAPWRELDMSQDTVIVTDIKLLTALRIPFLF